MTDQVPGPSKPERTMLSIVDVAEELGCGRDTVYSLLASGQLRSVRLSERLRRIRRSDLLAFVESLPVSKPVPWGRPLVLVTTVENPPRGMPAPRISLTS